MPHFPLRVQRYLATARDDLVAGRRHLVEAHDAADLSDRRVRSSSMASERSATQAT